MVLSAQHRKELREALVEVFPTKSSLKQMLWCKLNKNLEAITAEQEPQEIVFKIIQTAEAEGWIKDLIRAARMTNPVNSKLQAINQKLANELSSKNYIKQKIEYNKNRSQIGRNILVNLVNCFFFSSLFLLVLAKIGAYSYYKIQPYKFIKFNYKNENKITLGDLIVRDKYKYYRIEITVYNPLKRDISVSSLRINRKSQLRMSCSLYDYQHYIISDTVYISKLNQYKNLLIFTKNGALLAKYLAKGSQTDFCGSSSLELSFDTSFLLKASSYTSFLIDIPKELKVSQAKWVVSGKNINIQSLKTEMTSESFIADVLSFEIKVSMTTDIKQEISFTKNFIGSRVSAPYRH